MKQVPIAVLISGSGTNLRRLLDFAAEQPVGYRIAVVIADRAAPGLAHAHDHDIPTRIASWSDHTNRASFTAAICDEIDAFGCEFVVLAGFMRVLGPVAIERFPNRIVNIHPSLLPAFPGANAVEHALKDGVATTGVSVHFVVAEVDAGPLIAQREVAVAGDDDADSLHARIQEQEHDLYPRVVDALTRGRITVIDNEVQWT